MKLILSLRSLIVNVRLESIAHPSCFYINYLKDINICEAIMFALAINKQKTKWK
jgi:hypothetical protein